MPFAQPEHLSATGFGMKAKKSPSPQVAPKNDDERFDELFSVEKLRNTWKAVRRESRSVKVRDILDWVDLAVTIEATLPTIRKDILTGEYTPCAPTRYELAK